MDIKTFVKRLRENFNAQLETKPSWGKNQIKELFEMSIADTALEMKQEETEKCHEAEA